LTAVQVEFSKYKDILKGLLHPAGFKNYAEYPINKNISLATTLSSAKSVEVSGTVNVNSSIYVTGTNTRFITANTRGILTIGSNVAVNNQTRTVNAIISNTQFTVSSAFTMSSNTQSLIIVT
jgi:exosome complex RNA-binding protein Rrp4